MKAPVPYKFGITGDWRSDFDVTESHTKRLKKLDKRKDAEKIYRVCKHYITHFIPNAVAQENRYWIITCFPSTDQSPVRLSIWFPEVFNIHERGHYDDLGSGSGCMVFVHKDYFDKVFRAHLTDGISGLYFAPNYYFKTGISKQLAAFMPLDSYFDFVGHEAVYESIRAHNYELTLKGKTPFRGHNYEFVRFLFGDQSYMEYD